MTDLPSSAKSCASLPVVVVLPVPLTPTIRMTNGFFDASTTSGCATGASTLLHFIGEQRAHLVSGDVAIEPVAAQRLDDGLGHVDAEVGLDQQVLELVEHPLVEPLLGEDGGDPDGELVRRALEARGEPLEPVLLRLRRFELLVGVLLNVATVVSAVPAAARCPGRAAAVTSSSGRKLGFSLMPPSYPSAVAVERRFVNAVVLLGSSARSASGS